MLLQSPAQAQFLDRCSQSSQEAYEAFKALLAEIENPVTRPNGLRFWHDLTARFISQGTPEECLSKYYFSLSELVLRVQDGGETRLTLLQLPSTFSPEAWSFTFFEGLTRYQAAEFQARQIAELGCGIGWITLALAKQKRPSKIYGLDINPRAIVCSRLNLYLNAFDREARPTWQHEGKDLTEIVEFHVSDLLAHCRSHQVVLDRVIGCIPQVLNPDPDFTTKMLQSGVNESASDEFLHSLSNYAPVQGHIEDQFGLGLIARAVEESADVLRSSGKVILNLGGRPGTEVLKRLFLRRGFNVQSVWRTRVSQAKDTDIRSLVAIEARTSHRFEFFLEHGSDTPVSAATALAYAEAGGEIAHGLSVYEAKPRDPAQLPKILKLLRQPGYEDARRSIDLSFSEDSLALEKTSFLGAIAEQWEETRFFPYESTAGLGELRRRLGAFFRSYFRLHYDENHFVIAPSSAVVCKNVLKVFKPRSALVDSQLARALPGGDQGVLEIPRDADTLCELMEKLRPEVVIYSMPEPEARTRDTFLRLLDVSSRTKSRLFIDISDLLELSSAPTGNGIFRHLAQNPLPAHVALVCGLVKNRIYTDLEAAFLISENSDLLSAMTNAADLTYSRTPVLSQLYYDRILQDLLRFQIAEREKGGTERALTSEDGFFKKSFVGIPAPVEGAFKHPAIVGEGTARKTAQAIRLDYGENCLPAPRALKQALLESFVKMRITPEESDPSREVIALTARRFGLTSTEGLAVAFSGGVSPLFGELADHCARHGHAVVFPAGAYGYFNASTGFHKAKVVIAATQELNDFKMGVDSLQEALGRAGKGAWVALSAPVINPTGVVYSSDDLAALAKVAAKNGSVLLIDSVFSGLEFDSSKSHVPSGLSLSAELAGCRWAILGGLSKEFAAGGLRVGWGVSTDAEVLGAWRSGHLVTPHATLRYATKRVLSHYLRQDPGLMAELDAQKAELILRAKRLSEVLISTGWRVLAPQGGLFMTAKPEKILGRTVAGKAITIESIANLLRETTGVMINTPGWTGIPGYFRFVLSVEDSEFEKGLKGLRLFYEALK